MTLRKGKLFATAWHARRTVSGLLGATGRSAQKPAAEASNDAIESKCCLKRVVGNLVREMPRKNVLATQRAVLLIANGRSGQSGCLVQYRADMAAILIVRALLPRRWPMGAILAWGQNCRRQSATETNARQIVSGRIGVNGWLALHPAMAALEERQEASTALLVMEGCHAWEIELRPMPAIHSLALWTAP